MSARLPVLAKTGFILDPKPLQEASSAHAGVLAFSRAYRSLRVPELVAANLQLRARQRGFEEAQLIETILLLQIVGGDCPEDLSLLNADPMLGKAMGYELPKVTALRSFLERFHDEELAQKRPPREEQKSFIMPASGPVESLQQVQAGLVRRVARKYIEQGKGLTIGTVDQDATIIESHKRVAQAHYEGGRGYQPMVAVWAEADLVLADQWRDGNVPANQAPLECARMAFEALPESVKQRYFRGDSACHENELIAWLRSPERQEERGGRIGFCVSARMTADLQKAAVSVSEPDWKSFGKDPDGTQRQWVELDFVPGERGEKKDQKPLRYVGLRLLNRRGCCLPTGATGITTRW